ncbi:hypothetical protein H257_02632 [Aphanomyces astaci]|uniref:Amine oxidase domain-containing protein n=1 Tax=Aphanomyces astaci TaxID=112090 RepID=W4H3M1_APHAT|nr:hypothetical protein H257_02632 [Aphanomyces astaci]ETV86186.1 hypothetical protein H257_02632 [Aphanomyces astaci]RHX99414.1 hypothetical protein DYB36_000150 [Aphanomyces astaci]RHY44120.1 hypothetical protein DYB38_000569 [Aphanomyces astaci]RHY92880.1 hypothetical protein DYB35_000505 [Aphanomyces astaci]RHZ21200.1 hypothetical protein DYB37_000837 [Aphanomyces astaci]|eukprot:XP_009824658.1 hypothetical protein H257_02632 [Aphanomyces astaci]
MKVVVVGSGIGGISAAYHLVKDGHEVVLLEKEDYFGGHTYAIEVDGEPVDLGFMMFGDSNPNIKAWFKQFGITKEDGTTKTRIPMSLSVDSDIPGDIQFSSRKPFSSFWELFSIKKWQVIYDIFKFTVDLLTMPVTSNISTEEWAASGRYSKAFFRHYYLPFVSILWTVPKHDVMTLPASQFLRCLKTHSNSLYIPLWQVILGALGRRVDRPKHLWWYIGSAYKAPFLEYFESKGGVLKTNATATLVEEGGKAVVLASGERIECDHVVLASHADESAALLPWSKKNKLMDYYFHKSHMYVHRDESFLSKDKGAWSSWNVRIMDDDQYILTYWMNRIQHLKSTDNVFVTITPGDYKGRKPSNIVLDFPWDHPRRLVDCLPQDDIIQEEGITLSGAWLGRGFHEDGFVAGRRAAAIVNDKQHTKTVLYEDPGNIAVPAVPPFGMPLSVSTFFASVAAAAAFGVYKAAEHYTK